MKIRVENLSSVNVASFSELLQASAGFSGSNSPFTILMCNCYQAAPGLTYSPPLGLLLLVSALRIFFHDKVNIHFVDMRVRREGPEKIVEYLEEIDPDVVAVSALNCESEAAFSLAENVKSWSDRIITVLGGPVALHQAKNIIPVSRFDWVFSGAADRTFPLVLHRFFSGKSLGGDIPGFSYRSSAGGVYNDSQDLIMDLDALPLPAWDLVDFDAYSSLGQTRMTPAVANRRYAPIFTSRGCPYLCNYCHDVFTKRFVYRSAENVIGEMEVLYSKYGVREFHVTDDIFNLHKPRAMEILNAIAEKWPGKVFLAFPNGLRGDILEDEMIDAFVKAGTFQVSIAIETVSERLQSSIEKNLDIDRALSSINAFSRRGVIVTGSFMLGFPTETVREIFSTAFAAIRSGSLIAHFFPVVPQPGTPIYEMACKESYEATIAAHEDEKTKGRYNSHVTWYQRAYGFPLFMLISIVYLFFYLYPKRFFRILQVYPLSTLLKSVRFFLYQVIIGFFSSFASFFKRVVLRESDHGA